MSGWSLKRQQEQKARNSINSAFGLLPSEEIDGLIINAYLINGFKPNHFKDLEKKAKKEEEKRQQIQTETKKEAFRKRIESEKAEIALPRIWRGRKAYPEVFKNALKKYSKRDFLKVHGLALDRKVWVPTDKTETLLFFQWLSSEAERR